MYACVADIRWITGHSYVVYGPLNNGATSVLFESFPNYPTLVSGCCLRYSIILVQLILIGRYWEMVERLKIKQFYTVPTAIRLLLKCGDHYVHQYNRDTLRVLGCGM